MAPEPSGLSLVDGLFTKADRAPQVLVATIGLIIGGIFASHGCSLVKPLFVLTCAGVCSAQAYLLCREASNASLTAWAPAVSAAVGLLSLKLWHLAYPGFLFLIGCALGGVCVFVAFTPLMVKKEPAAMLGTTVLGALLFGLTFVRFHNVYWRLLFPAAGGFLVAAALRYYTAALAVPGAHWTQFAEELRTRGEVVLSASGAIFWTSWMVTALLGWYLQLAPLAGLREEQSLLPHWAPRLCPCLFGPEGILGPGYKTRTAAPTPAEQRLAARRLPQLPGSLEPAAEPLLGGVSAEDTDLLAEPSTPKAAADESGQLPQPPDYRPEGALLVAVVSVAALNWLLRARPLLFVGHAVLMSVAFLILATGGMVSYGSKRLLLPSLFLPRQRSRLPRHFMHGAFNGLALACALAGYGCIFANHREVGASQLGLESGSSWSRTLHVWIGYLVLVLLLLQAISGIFKLYILALLGSKKATFHHALGRAVYCLAAANQLIAYTFPGLLPNWATSVLAAMLIATVGTTLFFLEEKNRMEIARKKFEEAQRHFQETVRSHLSAETGNDVGKASSKSSAGDVPKLPSHETSAAAFEAAVMSIARESGRFLVQKVFIEWQRAVQRKRLEDAAIALEGQDRIVQFLSQELVDGVATDRRQSASASDDASDAAAGQLLGSVSHRPSS